MPSAHMAWIFLHSWNWAGTRFFNCPYINFHQCVMFTVAKRRYATCHNRMACVRFLLLLLLPPPIVKPAIWMKMRGWGWWLIVTRYRVGCELSEFFLCVQQGWEGLPVVPWLKIYTVQITSVVVVYAAADGTLPALVMTLYVIDMEILISCTYFMAV